MPKLCKLTKTNNVIGSLPVIMKISTVHISHANATTNRVTSYKLTFKLFLYVFTVKLIMTTIK